MKFRLSILTCLTLGVSSTLLAQDKNIEKPNIVFILADDLAWADVGFNGNKFYETPNLDSLCQAGMKFNRAYSGGPNCLPTRACFISGMYTPRTQIWTPGGRSKGNKASMKLDVTTTGPDAFVSKLTLQPSVTSIAEVLHSVGYKTARFGKWHVGPDTQGFDISDPSGKGDKIGKKFYGNIDVHEWLTDASCKFIRDNNDKPFFLYLSHWDVHGPTKARPEIVAKYKKKLESKDWDRKWNPTYAAMIQAVDTSVARVRATLKEQGLEEKTLFIFSSDNGGTPVTTNKPLKGAKGSLFEGGVRVPTFMTWPAMIKAGSECDTPVTSVDFLPTFADLAKAKLPTAQPVDGVSIAPLFAGKSIPDRSIFWHYPLYLSGSGEGKVHPIAGTDNLYWRGVPASMIMRGPWKLMHLFEDNSIRLFNVDEDLSESQDLSKKHPEKAAELLAELKKWQADTKAAIPTKVNAKFTPKAAGNGKRANKNKK
ncbi:aryl-sulfate sulfohydrolase [Oceaniferula spumae]|uniref:Aryl-sulfate sulfohydrolase n=1 Tax=Oceaniferula spumae TaxID=2979115 RepID=A0AAT9FKU1_9BACT